MWWHNAVFIFRNCGEIYIAYYVSMKNQEKMMTENEIKKLLMKCHTEEEVKRSYCVDIGRNYSRKYTQTVNSKTLREALISYPFKTKSKGRALEIWQGGKFIIEIHFNVRTLKIIVVEITEIELSIYSMPEYVAKVVNEVANNIPIWEKEIEEISRRAIVYYRKEKINNMAIRTTAKNIATATGADDCNVGILKGIHSFDLFKKDTKLNRNIRIRIEISNFNDADKQFNLLANISQMVFNFPLILKVTFNGSGRQSRFKPNAEMKFLGKPEWPELKSRFATGFNLKRAVVEEMKVKVIVENGLLMEKFLNWALHRIAELFPNSEYVDIASCKTIFKRRAEMMDNVSQTYDSIKFRKCEHDVELSSYLFIDRNVIPIDKELMRPNLYDMVCILLDEMNGNMKYDIVALIKYENEYKNVPISFANQIALKTGAHSFHYVTNVPFSVVGFHYDSFEVNCPKENIVELGFSNGRLCFEIKDEDLNQEMMNFIEEKLCQLRNMSSEVERLEVNMSSY